MKISIIHPSRNRSNKAFQTALQWIGNLSNTVDFEYILSLDFDDSSLGDYQELFNTIRFVRIQVGNNRNAVEAINGAALGVKGNLLVVVSDDFECFQNWDLAIIEATKGKENFLLKTNDGTQGWIVTLPIMDYAFYNSNGHVYYPSYKHMFCDTDLTHKADLEKKLIIRNDIEFIHNHYSVNHSHKDDVSEKADSTWTFGEALYLLRCKTVFGTEYKDIFDISPQANGHIAWLKNKLNYQLPSL